MPLKFVYSWTQNLRNRDFLLFDILVFFISPIVSLFIRLDGVVDWAQYGVGLVHYTLFFFVIKIILLYYFGIYKRFWKYASVDDLAKLGLVLFLISITQIVTSLYANILGNKSIVFLPISVAIIDGIISSILIISSRLSIRLVERAKQRSESKENGIKILIIGAGHAGLLVLDELLRRPKMGIPVAFLDDDNDKQNLKIRGIEVFGKLVDIQKAIKNKSINKVILALPTVSGKLIRELADQCEKMQVEVLTLPSIHDIIDGKVNITQLRKIQVEDLLRREPNQIDSYEISKLLHDEVVMITGGGGSIGSELCRQIISFKPHRIVFLGHGENSIFEIEQELQKYVSLSYGPINIKEKLHSYICDIRDYDRLERIFSKEKPNIIYHAAAHKHVPLMEENTEEAITNNVLGTRNLVKLSNEFNVEQFVLISSDKAVNPTSVMGVTKRLAEIILLNASKQNKCKFGAVRFGNVLGSRGSVIRTFNRQIKSGGPITVTHPDIKRFFMTIPEAVSLVLQVCVYNKGGEIFILDMGEPIKILDLAKDVIKLSGLKEEDDIDIKFTGLRTGEKLFEELFIKGEIYDKTRHEKIFIAKNASQLLGNDTCEKVDQLIKIASAGHDKEALLSKLKEIVPEFEHKKN